MSLFQNRLTKNSYILLSLFFLVLAIGLILLIKSCSKKDANDYLSESNFPSIKIMVQNGCGFNGVAQNVRNSLINKNIDVVGIGNSRKFIYDESLIVVKHDDEVDLRRLKNMTGIENVIYAVDENYFVPFIIVAGKDYQKFFKTVSF